MSSLGSQIQLLTAEKMVSGAAVAGDRLRGTLDTLMESAQRLAGECARERGEKRWGVKLETSHRKPQDFRVGQIDAWELGIMKEQPT